MARVIPVEAVRYTPAVAVLECGEDAPISFYVTEFKRGEGTPLHLHPSPEVFLVKRNTAVFTAGDEELTVTEGHYVLVPANLPRDDRELTTVAGSSPAVGPAESASASTASSTR
jgi:mannose-6-phosphate isomerase-like protein (cupin superfamily)